MTNTHQAEGEGERDQQRDKQLRKRLVEAMPKPVPDGPIDDSPGVTNSKPWEVGYNEAIDQAVAAVDRVLGE